MNNKRSHHPRNKTAKSAYKYCTVNSIAEKRSCFLLNMKKATQALPFSSKPEQSSREKAKPYWHTTEGYKHRRCRCRLVYSSLRSTWTSANADYSGQNVASPSNVRDLYRICVYFRNTFERIDDAPNIVRKDHTAIFVSCTIESRRDEEFYDYGTPMGSCIWAQIRVKISRILDRPLNGRYERINRKGKMLPLYSRVNNLIRACEIISTET